jgi:hypothetical protein
MYQTEVTQMKVTKSYIKQLIKEELSLEAEQGGAMFGQTEEAAARPPAVVTPEVNYKTLVGELSELARKMNQYFDSLGVTPEKKSEYVERTVARFKTAFAISHE